MPNRTISSYFLRYQRTGSLKVNAFIHAKTSLNGVVIKTLSGKKRCRLPMVMAGNTRKPVFLQHCRRVAQLCFVIAENPLVHAEHLSSTLCTIFLSENQCFLFGSGSAWKKERIKLRFMLMKGIAKRSLILLQYRHDSTMGKIRKKTTRAIWKEKQI